MALVLATLAAADRLGAQALDPEAAVVSGPSASVQVSGRGAPAEAAGPAVRLAHPFGIGEELVYDVTSSRLGQIGEGALRVEGPETVRGRSVYRLSFDIDSRVGPMRIVDETRSWLEPERLQSLRYHKREQHPLARRTETVELFPEERQWVSESGDTARSATAEPLDELSFLYFLRTLELRDSAEYVIERHFDPERNPVIIRVLGREQADLPSGLFETILVEMEVRDGGRFGGRGVLRLYLTDDEARYPVRIVTSVPLAGELILDLKALTPGVALADAFDAKGTRGL